MIGVEDILIAAVAMKHKLKVATDNTAHFNRVQGLTILWIFTLIHRANANIFALNVNSIEQSFVRTSSDTTTYEKCGDADNNGIATTLFALLFLYFCKK